jgi:hypothetical protein
MALTAAATPDGKFARMAFGNVEVYLNAEELEAFIVGLGDIRSRLSPQVADHPPVDRPAHQFEEPDGRVGGDPQTHQVVLALRTATIGWLFLRFSPQRAGKIASQLMEAADHTEQLARSRAN